MSSNKTPNYGLHDWIGSDFVKRAEIVENFEILDAQTVKGSFPIKKTEYSGKVDITVGPGVAGFGSSSIEKTIDTKVSIVGPVINTDYYLYIKSDGTFFTNTTGVVVTGAIKLWKVSVGATLSTITTKDMRPNIVADINPRLVAVEDEQLNKPAVAVTLNRGQNLVANSGKGKTPFSVLNLKGRTLVNLLGRDGNCEDLSKWIMNSNGGAIPTANGSLDTANAIYGVNVIKFTTPLANSDGINVKSNPSLVSTKFYIVIGEFKLGTGATGVAIRNYNGATSKLSPISTSGLAWVKLTGADVGSTTNQIGMFVYGPQGSVGYIDGVRVFEISQSEYNTLDTLTDAQIKEKYPYVDDVKHIANPYIVKQGKQIAPPFSDWGLHAQADVLEPYKLSVVANGTTIINYPANIKCLPNQLYTLSGSTSPQNLGVYFDIEFRDASGASLGDSANLGNGLVTFTTPVNADSMVIRAVVEASVTSGTYTFDKPMLNLGDTALLHEPMNQDVLYIPTTLASNMDGTVYDTLYERDGHIRKLKRFHTMDLDGSLAWLYDQDKVGYKNVYCNAIPPHLDSSETVVKYDGKILKSIRPATDTATFLAASDQSLLNAAINITVTDTDSGWGETYAPTADEIKAYFNGWVMYNNAAGGAPNNPANNTYNGTGTKAWAYRNADGTTYGGGTTVLPALLAPNFKPYKFIYQLATEVEEVVLGETGLALHDGANQVELGEGLIVREVANLISDGTAFFANTTTAGYEITKFKYRTNKILAVYKNGVRDSKVIIESHANAYGGQRFVFNKADFDPTAEYTVSYYALDKYAVSNNVQTIDGQYASNLKGVVDANTQNIADVKRQADVIAITLEGMRTKPSEEPWIAPTLLNGYTNQAVPVGYYKDSLGVIRLRGQTNGSTVNAAVFNLPPGYRPAFDLTFMVAVNLSYNAPNTPVTIKANGDVYMGSNASNPLSLNAISFRAEQ